MKTTRLMVILVWIAGGVSAVAAQSGEPRHVDKHLIVSTSPTPGIPAAAAREPVTFLGVAVASTEPVLAAQLRLPEGQGLVVNVVESDSPAAKAGLQQHDILTKLDDQILIDPRQLSVLVRNRKEGDKVTLTYVRAGAEARATATLATHLPGPEAFFHWMGGRPADVFLRTEKFAPGAEIELRTPDGPHPVPFHLRVPGGPGHPGELIGSGEGRVMIFRPQAGVVFADEVGSIEMQMDEHGQNLTAKNTEGEVVFSGPVTTPEQRAALPDDLRKRLEKFEALGVFESPAPAGATGGAVFTPAGRAGVGSPVL